MTSPLHFNSHYCSAKHFLFTQLQLTPKDSWPLISLPFYQNNARMISLKDSIITQSFINTHVLQDKFQTPEHSI